MVTALGGLKCLDAAPRPSEAPVQRSDDVTPARRADAAAEGRLPCLLPFAFTFGLPLLGLGFGLAHRARFTFASHSPHKSPIIDSWKRLDDSPLLTHLLQALGK